MPENKYTGPKLPEWWFEPEPADLKVERIDESQHSQASTLSDSKVNGKDYKGFFPHEFVSRKKMVMSALIAADAEGGWFVRIPAETFQGGPRVIVPHAEKDTLIIRHPENVQT